MNVDNTEENVDIAEDKNKENVANQQGNESADNAQQNDDDKLDDKYEKNESQDEKEDKGKDGPDSDSSLEKETRPDTTTLFADLGTMFETPVSESSPSPPMLFLGGREIDCISEVSLDYFIIGDKDIFDMQDSKVDGAESPDNYFFIGNRDIFYMPEKEVRVDSPDNLLVGGKSIFYISEMEEPRNTSPTVKDSIDEICTESVTINEEQTKFVNCVNESSINEEHDENEEISVPIAKDGTTKEDSFLYFYVGDRDIFYISDTDEKHGVNDGNVRDREAIISEEYVTKESNTHAVTKIIEEKNVSKQSTQDIEKHSETKEDTHNEQNEMKQTKEHLSIAEEENVTTTETESVEEMCVTHEKQTEIKETEVKASIDENVKTDMDITAERTAQKEVTEKSSDLLNTKEVTVEDKEHIELTPEVESAVEVKKSDKEDLCEDHGSEKEVPCFDENLEIEAKEQIDKNSPGVEKLDLSFVDEVEDNDTESITDAESQELETSLSNEDFIKKLNKNDTQLMREMNEWKKRYGVESQDAETARLMEGEVDLSSEGLSEDDIREVNNQLTYMKNLPLNELLDLVMS